MNYWRRYGGDYLGDTLQLSMVEDGAYTRLLDYYYTRESVIPPVMGSVIRLVRAVTDEERAAVESVLRQHFTLEVDGWHNKRADKEIKIARQARENGGKGGRPLLENGLDLKTENLTEQVTGSVTEAGTETVTGSGHPPTAKPLNRQPLPPKPLNHQPLTLSQNHSPPAQKSAARRGNGKNTEPLTAETWNAYRLAYFDRYGVEPVRNATTNAHIAQVLRRLGTDEAPLVAAFYLTHRNGLYVNAKHPTNLLLRDCEGLRTEWASGRMITRTAANLEDRAAATADAFAPLIEEAKARERRKDGAK